LRARIHERKPTCDKVINGIQIGRDKISWGKDEEESYFDLEEIVSFNLGEKN